MKRRTSSAASHILDSLRHNLKHAARGLARSPAYTLVSVLSLAFGVAGATVFFSFVNAMLFRPAPHVEAAADLVAIYAVDSLADHGRLSYPDVVEIRRQSASSLEGVAAVGTAQLTVGEPGAERQLMGEQVSENYFDLLGISLAHGRGFTAADIEAGGDVVILGHRLWEREYGRDPEVLGDTLRINGRFHTIVGVAPPGMLAWRAPLVLDLWVPIEPSWRDHRIAGLSVIGRMRPGASRQQVQAQLDLVAARLVEEFPEAWRDFRGEAQGLAVLSERQDRVPPQFRRQTIGAMVMLTIVITLVLLVACSNVANLALARAVRRREEIAVRLALGASRRRLVGQLLSESVIIAGLAVALAFFLTYWITDFLAAGLGPVPVAIDVGVDHQVVGFCVVLVAAVAVAFGLAPALQASKPNLAEALKGHGDRVRFRRFALRHLLVVAQVAGSLVLVVAATLLLRSFRELRHADLGFEPLHVAAIRVDLSQRSYEELPARQFYADLTDRLRALPEIESVALAQTVLLGPIHSYERPEPEGYEGRAAELPLIGLNVVSPGYFDLVGMALVGGRDFRSADNAAAPRVVIVSQAFAERFWPGQNPIGKRVKLDAPAEVIGVVRDASYRAVTEEPEPYLWLPFGQHYAPDMAVHVRTRGAPRPLLATLRDEVRALDGKLPAVAAELLEKTAAEATLVQRNLSVLLGAVGAVTLGLAMLGIYGVMVFAVSQRRREVGIRIALGASPDTVVGMVLGEGLRLSVVGLVAGFAVVLVVTRLMSSLLYGVSPLDPVSLAGGATLLVAASIAATLPAARRAARVDPMESLRAE